MQPPRLYSALAMAGTLPFVACALLPLLGVDSVPPLGPLDAVASSYALAIIAFLAGAHWGNYLAAREQSPLNLFVSSNVIFLFAWIAFVGASLAGAIVAQLIAFLLLLLIDYRLKGKGIISNHYFRTRATATAIACVSLLVVLIA